jgi:hypothetical protein
MNELRCPKCGKKTEIIYESSNGKTTLGIQCTREHPYPKRIEGHEETIMKHEVFLIELTSEEIKLYRNEKLHVGKDGYGGPPQFKKDVESYRKKFHIDT